MKKLIILLSILTMAVGCSTFETNQKSDQKIVREVSQENKSRTDFNLYETNWSIFKDVPLYNQSGLPACYAYASSQLTEYYLRKTQQLKSSNEHVSPLWGAFLFKDKSGNIMTPMNWVKQTVGYGFSRVTINQLKKYGICKSSIIDQNVKKILPNYADSDGSVIGLVELVWPHKDLNSAEEILNKIQDDRAYIRILRNYTSQQDETVQYRQDADLDKKVLLQQIKDVQKFINAALNQLDKKTYLEFFDKYILAGCDQEENIQNFDISKVKVAGQWYASNKKISRKISQAFEEVDYSYPIAVGYCSNIYKPENPEHRVKPRQGLLPRIFDRALNGPSTCSAHYSLLVGRRTNAQSGETEYLVRNSYGNTYMPISEGCFCRNMQTESFENCGLPDKSTVYPDKNLVVLGCWIDEKKLADSIYDINHISIQSVKDLEKSDD